VAKGFNYFMVHVEAGRHLRLGVLTPAERCAWTHGVLAIAAKAEMRGAFMVAERPATASDVALQANVPERVAASMLRKARETRLLEHDSEIGADWVRDFEQHNPEPKADATAAKRAREYRARQKAARDASRSVTRDGRDDHGAITPPEVEGEEEGKKDDDETRASAQNQHPLFDQVMDRLAVVADLLPVGTDDAGVLAEIGAAQDAGDDPLELADATVGAIRDYHQRGTLKARRVSNIMNAIRLRRGQQRDLALAAEGTKARLAYEKPARGGKPSVQDRIADRERRIEEQKRLEALEEQTRGEAA
jgi:hypothetical protein